MAGCGDLPRPFAGNPGSTARRLAQPPPARLAVVPPSDALLTSDASRAYAGALMAALQHAEVPAVAGPPRRGDWRLVIGAELRGATVVPLFHVQNPGGDEQGVVEGQPVDARQWSDPAMPALSASASAAANPIVSLLTRIEAQRRQNDPNSLLNRPARIAVPDVIGAPGDGNRALTRQFRLQVPQVGELLASATDDADFVVQGQVALATGEKGQRIEIQWVVSTPDGNEVGRVVQLNDIVPGSLDGLWGDVALVVAQEAAGGVRDVVLNQAGKRATTPAAAR